MPITWQPSLSTGVPHVDNEHKELFRQINLLEAAMREGKGREKVEEILDFLDDYTRRHFAAEERTMDQVGCPAAEENRRAHAAFIAKFEELRERVNRSGASSAVVIEMSNYLGNWLASHIAQIDAQLSGCLTNA